MFARLRVGLQKLFSLLDLDTSIFQSLSPSIILDKYHFCSSEVRGKVIVVNQTHLPNTQGNPLYIL